jgi:hypothetical protein
MKITFIGHASLLIEAGGLSARGRGKRTEKGCEHLAVMA